MPDLALFAHVAKRPGAPDDPRFASMVEHADAILAAAARQGDDRCGFPAAHVTTAR